jgi:hypothetical protein
VGRALGIVPARAQENSWRDSLACGACAAELLFRPRSIKNPNGDDPNEEEILKPVCFVFDFASTRALRQLSEYGIGLSPNEPNPENAVKDLVSFLPVLAYDGANMTQ